MGAIRIIVFVSGVVILLGACSPKPLDIAYGFDQCVYCKMTIVDPKFGAELVTKKGRIYKFDAIECMVRYDAEQDKEIHAYLVNSFSQPGELVPVASCQFLISENIPSPMGANLSAHLRGEELPELAGKVGDHFYAWKQLRGTLIQ